jgi:Domain of unknown function (DUF4157)
MIFQSQLARPREQQSSVQSNFRPHLQRKCACGGTPGPSGECNECRKKRLQRQSSRERSAASTAESKIAPPIVRQVLKSSGEPLNHQTRAAMEQLFGFDFSNVRVHNDSRAADSARAVNAKAYTVGRQIVFDSARYEPGTTAGNALLAHELAHVVQQSDGVGSWPGKLPIGSENSTAEEQANRAAERALDSTRGEPIQTRVGTPISVQRLCSPAAVCAAPIPGSAGEFGSSEEAKELGPRDKRKKQTPAKAVADGHSGRASELEKFFQSQDPTAASNIHGIIIDRDLSAGTGAMTMNCAAWAGIALPPGFVPASIAGATKDCAFIHGELNAQAQLFNIGKAATIGGLPREDWRVQTTQTLTHEVQHVVFEKAPHPKPAGVTTPTCTPAAVKSELSELAAVTSEFPVAFRAIPAAPGPQQVTAQKRVDDWFKQAVTNPGESIKGALLKMGCACECNEVDLFVTDTFNFVSSSWSKTEKNAFNGKLQDPVWGIKWPLKPIP